MIAGRLQSYFIARKVRRNFFPHVSTVMWPSPQPWHNVRGTWYSHQVADGIWCTGREKTTVPGATEIPHTPPAREEETRASALDILGHSTAHGSR
jgi:hypothetical protein